MSLRYFPFLSLGRDFITWQQIPARESRRGRPTKWEWAASWGLPETLCHTFTSLPLSAFQVELFHSSQSCSRRQAGQTTCGSSGLTGSELLSSSLSVCRLRCREGLASLACSRGLSLGQSLRVKMCPRQVSRRIGCFLVNLKSCTRLWDHSGLGGLSQNTEQVVDGVLDRGLEVAA